MNSLVVVHDLTLDAVHLRCLLANFLLQFGQLVLQWLQYFFRDFLLLDQLLLARHALLLPVVVLLAHGVDVVGHEVDTLAERVRTLAKNLDGLLHELNVLLGEGTCHARRLLNRFVRIGSSSGFGGRLLVTALLSSRSIWILLTDTVHLDLRSCILNFFRWPVLILLQQSLCLADKCTATGCKLIRCRVMVLCHNTLVIVLPLLALLNEMLLLHIRIHHLLLFLLLIKHSFLFNLHLLPHQHLLLDALLLLPLLLR